MLILSMKKTWVIGILLVMLIPVISIGTAVMFSRGSNDGIKVNTSLNTEEIDQIKSMISNILEKNQKVSSSLDASASEYKEGTFLLQFSNLEERNAFLTSVSAIHSKKRATTFQVLHAYQNFPVVLVRSSSNVVQSLKQTSLELISVAANRPIQMVFDPREIFSDEFKDASPVSLGTTSRVIPSTILATVNLTGSFISPVALQQFGSDIDLDTIPARVTNATKLWDLGYKGKNVRIAIADTGIWGGHPDLNVALVRNYVTTEYGYDFPEDENDGHGHGTHVAGIAVGTGAASDGKYVGMAPEATLYSLKVATSFGSATPAGVLAAIDDAIDLGVDVLSMSLGFSGGDADDIISRAMDKAVESGIIVTVSAGNSGPSFFTISSPATARKVLTVGAATYEFKMAEFSSRGPSPDGRADPDVIAPGVNVISALSRNSVLDEALNAIEGYNGVIRGDGGDYIPLSGTSMAAPVVAGAVALLRQAFPQATPLEIKAAIQATAKKLFHSQGIYATGSGFLDVLAAYNYLASNQGQVDYIQPERIEFIDPPQFAGDRESMVISVISSHLNTLSIRVTGNVSSFVIVPSTVELDMYGYGEFPINVSIPFSVLPGTYTGAIELLSSQQQVVATVDIDPLIVQQPRARILWDLWHNDFPDSIYINFFELQNYLEDELGYSLVLWDEPWNLHDFLQFDLVVLPDPEVALTPHDRAVLSDYLFFGGNVIFLASYGPNYEVNTLNEFLDPLGIQFSSSLLPPLEDQGIAVSFTGTEVGSATLNATYFKDLSSKISWPLGSRMEVIPSKGTSVGAYITSSDSTTKIPVIAQVNLSSFSEYPLPKGISAVRPPSATKPGNLIVMSSELIWYDWHWLSLEPELHQQFTRNMLDWILTPTIDRSVKLSTSSSNIDWTTVGLQLHLNTTEVLSNQTVTATMRIFDTKTNSYSPNLPSQLVLLVLNQSAIVRIESTTVNSNGIATINLDPGSLPTGWYTIGIAVNDTQNQMTVFRIQLLHVRNVLSQDLLSPSASIARITSEIQGFATSRPSDWTSILQNEEVGLNETTMIYKNQQVTFTITVNTTSRFDRINAMVFEIGEGLSSLIVRNVTTFVTFEELKVAASTTESSSQKTYETSWSPPPQAHQGQYLLLIEAIEDWNGSDVVTDQQGFSFFVYEDQPRISPDSSSFNGNPLGSVNNNIQQVSLGQEISVRISGDDLSDSLEHMEARVLFIHYYFFLMTGVILENYDLQYSPTNAAFEGTIGIPNQQALPISGDNQQFSLKTGGDQIYALVYVLRDSQGNYDLDVVPFVIQGSALTIDSSAGFIIILLLLVILGAVFFYFWQRSKKTSSRLPPYPPYTSYQQFYNYPGQISPPSQVQPTQPTSPVHVSSQDLEGSEKMGLDERTKIARRFCRYCGFAVGPTDVFCGNCGKRL